MTVVSFVAFVITSLIAALGANSAFATWRAERRHPPTGQFVSVDGVRLHYRELGSGRPIVLLHGVSANLRDFDRIAIRLAARHRVIAFDRPGYGHSGRPSTSWVDPARQATLIHQALMRLGVKRPVLVGHSWSGSLVLAYALAYPDSVAGCVLLAGAVSPWGGKVAWYIRVAGWPFMGKLFAWTCVLPIARMVRRRYIRAVFRPENPPADYAERTGTALAMRPRAFLASAEDVRFLSGFLEEQSRHYDEIMAPILIVTGERDTIVPAWNHGKRLANRISHARLVEIRGAGHAFHQSRDVEVTTLIGDFVTQTANNRCKDGSIRAGCRTKLERFVA